MILGGIKLEPSIVDIVKTPPQTFLPLRGDTTSHKEVGVDQEGLPTRVSLL